MASYRKKVRAVFPYLYSGQLNFKDKPVLAWKGEIVKGWYPRILHKLMFNINLPTIWFGEARLVFVQPRTLYFDVFSSVLTHEIIPFVWDCWEEYDAKMSKWMIKHKVRKAIFTSEISAKRIKKLIPDIDILVITEGISTNDYPAGKELCDRAINMFNYGRMPEWAPKSVYCSDVEFAERLTETKTTIAVPRNDVFPKCHETLTQRYWECMLSRIVMIGRAPKELIDLIGYDPVVKLDMGDIENSISRVISNINNFQKLVDKNRRTALEMGDWKLRMDNVKSWLLERGYNC